MLERLKPNTLLSFTITAVLFILAFIVVVTRSCDTNESSIDINQKAYCFETRGSIEYVRKFVQSDWVRMNGGWHFQGRFYGTSDGQPKFSDVVEVGDSLFKKKGSWEFEVHTKGGDQFNYKIFHDESLDWSCE